MGSQPQRRTRRLSQGYENAHRLRYHTMLGSHRLRSRTEKRPCTSMRHCGEMSASPTPARKPPASSGSDSMLSGSFEICHDPFFPLLEAALATERLRIGTNIAVAFARTPFSMAVSAWDLQAVSRGRLLLGLGTQVRPHVERRFSAEFDHPAARGRGLHRLPARHLEHVPDRSPPELRGPVLPVHPDQRFLQPRPDRPSEHSDLPCRGESADGRCRGGGRRRVQRASHAFAGISPRGHPPCSRRGRAKARQAGASTRPGSKLLRGPRRDRIRAQSIGTRGPATDRVLRIDTGLPDISGVPRRTRRCEAAQRAHA